MSESATTVETIVHTTTSRATVPEFHVLLADSNIESRERRYVQLRDAGWRVSLARTGFEAIVKASCQVPDLILVDGGLADIEAEETCRLLTTCPVTAHIPVILLRAGRPVSHRTMAGLRRQAARPS